MKPRQNPSVPDLFAEVPAVRSNAEILSDVRSLHGMWRDGRLGGEVMPEDAHPPLSKKSDELAIYFTLGMALNYQRNSYSLWRACTAAYECPETSWVFDPARVVAASKETLGPALTRFKVALQPNKHTEIWQRNSQGLLRHGAGGVLGLFEKNDFDIARIKSFIQENKSDFPYLCGPKICNYWLYVMSEYLDWPMSNRSELSVAPDTHVISASKRLGLLEEEHQDGAKLAAYVARRWGDVLDQSEFSPIDIHTPLWLWSRSGFRQIEGLPPA